MALHSDIVDFTGLSYQLSWVSNIEPFKLLHVQLLLTFSSLKMFELTAAADIVCVSFFRITAWAQRVFA